MICELCKGKGWVQGQAPDIPTACPACGGKGFVEMTNEEYIHSLNTEELAEWIYRTFDEYSFCEHFCELHCDNDTGMQCDGNFKRHWEEWLKEIHK